jgi:hyperosmotically inducible periplasmic protein
MQNTTRDFRQNLLVVAASAVVAVVSLMTPQIYAAQDPRQPDSYNNASGVPAEKPANTAPTAADRAMTQKIHKAIAADKSLSAEARRVKVTTQGGKVTLQGAAQSEAERTSIYTKAADVAGGTNVVNNIKVPGQQQP